LNNDDHDNHHHHHRHQAGVSQSTDCGKQFLPARKKFSVKENESIDFLE
jgi:hypothetical protein